MDTSEQITQAVGAVKEASAWLKDTGTDKVAIEAAKGFFGWLKSAFKGKPAKTIEQLEIEINERLLITLETQFDMVLEEDENLRNELSIKLKELEEAFKNKEPQVQKHNEMKVVGDNNISMQDIQGSQISFGEHQKKDK